MSWIDSRELVRKIHLWIGLIGGVFIFIICLTGTILVFEDEIIETLNPQIYKIEKTEIQLPFSDLKNRVESATNKSVIGFAFEKSTVAPFEFFVKKKGEKGRPETVFVNPYSGDILGNNKQLKGKEFFMFNFKLHRWFLMETEIGRPIVGFFTIAFVFAMISGLIIWFPRKIKYWRQGLKVKWRASWKRVNHDFHTAFGLYSAIFLIILALTGLNWSFEWYRNGLSEILGAQVFDRTQREINIENIGKSSLSLDEMVEKSAADLKEYNTLRYKIPADMQEVVEVNAYHGGFAALSIPDQFVYNPVTGKMLQKKLFRDLSLGEKIAKSIHDIHMGYIFGSLSKWIFFISSVVATLLPITGVLIWWNKRKKKFEI